MVNEIVHIQVGGCGNHIGNAFWKVLCKEHRINPQTGAFEGDQKDQESPLELQRIGVYFDEDGQTKKYIPRACLIDLDPSTADLNKTSALAALYKPDNQFYGDGDAAGVWPEGHYDKGADRIDECMDGIRKQTETCDALQGFQTMHGISGGTGGGMGTALLLKLRDEYPDKRSLTFSVFPSSEPNLARSEHDIPSAVLSIHQLLENSDLSFILDNDALTNVVAQHQKSAPQFADLNRVIATTMAHVTASLRWPCDMNNEMGAMCINLVPFPRLHFILMSCVPVYAADMAVNGVCNALWNSSNWSVNVPPDCGGKYMGSCLSFRGGNMQQLNFSKVGHYQRTIDAMILLKGWVKHVETYQTIPTPILELCANFVEENFIKFLQECSQPMYEFEWEVEKYRTVAPERFVNWIPDSTQSQMIRGNTALFANDELQFVQGTGVMMSNHTCIKIVFDKICKAMKRISVANGGMSNGLSGGGLLDEMEMQEADKNVRDLVVEYQDKEDAIVELEDDDSDEEDEDEDDDDEDDEDEDDDF